MEATNDGLWDWNIKTDDAYFSPAYYRMLGYEPGDFPVKGRSWEELIHPDDRETALRAITDCVECKCEHFAVKFRMRTKIGGWRWILCRRKCIKYDEQDKAIRCVGTHMESPSTNRLRRDCGREHKILESLKSVKLS